MKLTPVAPGLWELNAPLSIAGMHLGHRMTVAQLADRKLWLHSPVEYSRALAEELGALGEIAHIVAPSVMHDTYLEAWNAAQPQARFHAAPGLAPARTDLRFTDVLDDTPPPAWAGLIAQHVMRGMPRVNEVVFLHRPSRTLILTDLVFNLGPDMPFLSRVLLKLNDCDCKFAVSRLLKSTIKDRGALRRSLDHVLAWDFDRVIVSHGANVESEGKPRLREAFAFL